MRGSRHNKQIAVMRGGQTQHEPLTPPCAPVAIAAPCAAQHADEHKPAVGAGLAEAGCMDGSKRG